MRRYTPINFIKVVFHLDNRSSEIIKRFVFSAVTAMTAIILIMTIIAGPKAMAVTNYPYFVVQGGDVHAGMSFGSPETICTDPETGVTQDPCSCEPWNGTMFSSWNNNNANGNGYYGGAVQGADFISDVSFDVVTDLNSEAPITFSGGNPNYQYTAPASPSYLGFANLSQNYSGHHDPYPVDPVSGYYGGGWFDYPCQTEKYVQTMNSGTTPLSSSPALSGNTVNLSELHGGNYSYSGDVLYVDDETACGCNTPVTYASEGGVPITIAVSGNLYIESNILYSYSNPTQIPQVNIYAGWDGPGRYVNQGNIFIDKSVTEIHGNFTAEGNDLDATEAYNSLEDDYLFGSSPTGYTDGLVSDCSFMDGHGNYSSTADYDPCNTQLQIDGSIGGNVYFLERSFGDLDNIRSGTTNTANAAEVFQYSPEVWLPDAIGSSCNGDVSGCIGTNYESVTKLPPSL